MKTKLLTILTVILAALAVVACTSGGGTQGGVAQTTGTETATSAPNSLTPVLITITATPTPSATPAPPAPTATPPDTVTPTATASPSAPTPTPTPSSPQAEVVSPEINVRQGPGVAYPATTTAKAGDLLDVTGVNAARDWLQVTLADGKTGWISGKPDYTRVQGSLDGVPVVAVAPPPQPAPGAASQAGGAGGGKLVFMANSGGDIYIINADGSGLRRLTGGIDPALSPDGSQVAFARWIDIQRGALGSVWVIKTDGSGERVVLDEVHQPKSPTWSPDGKELAINMQQGGWTDNLYNKCGNPGEVPPDARHVQPIFEPDGTFDKVCWKMPPNPFWGLRMIDLAAGTFEDLPRDTHSFGPTWDPRNSWRIVYRGDKGLVQLDMGQSTTTAFTDDVNDHTPIFSPDGSRLAVSYMQHDHWEIHVMNADGSGRARLTETPLSDIVDQQLAGLTPRSWNNVAPTWSPDGSQIAFLSDRSGKWEIWVMNADGSNQHPMFAPDTLKGINFQYNGVDERMLSWGR
jgi:dipeptidyl aminopeptidase/acylaminoacyl peptidase